MLGWILRGVLLVVATRVIGGMFRGGEKAEKRKEEGSERDRNAAMATPTQSSS